MQRSGNKKQEKQKAAAQQAERNRQSKADRNKNRIRQYQSVDKNAGRQQAREQVAYNLGKQGKNIAHGFGGQGSGVSGKGQGIIAAINAGKYQQKGESQGKQSASSGKKKSGKPQGPSISNSEFRDRIQRAAGFAKGSIGGGIDKAKSAYVLYCSQHLTQYGYTAEDFEEWANDWAEEWAESQKQLEIPEEEPSSGLPPKKDDDSDDEGSGAPEQSPGFSLDPVLISVQ